ncbi:LacI family transcriptional regulator [Betaproteobacteria bacterium GR16-43]|nr:LacI family transcriptional regulator [Betaproteobacteria bacterium GR16-43]
MTSVKRRSLLALAAAVSFAAAVGAQAQYPAKPVTIIVPFPPGGGTDTGTRLLAQKLSERWGQPVVVENKPGAAGAIGAELVSRAKNDGYTLLMGNVGTQSVNPSLYKLNYNPDTAFAPITLVAHLPLVMLVNPAVPAKTAKEMIALAAAKPGSITCSNSGSGGAPHLAAAIFENEAKLQIVHVPYKGGGPAIADLIAGHVQLSFATVLESSSNIQAGKLRALAVTGLQRSPVLPDVPTLAEGTLPGFDAASWIALFAPAGTPREIVDKVTADVRHVLANGDLREKLVQQGAVPEAEGPVALQKLIDRDRARYAKVIKDKNIAAN